MRRVSSVPDCPATLVGPCGAFASAATVPPPAPPPSRLTLELARLKGAPADAPYAASLLAMAPAASEPFLACGVTADGPIGGEGRGESRGGEAAADELLQVLEERRDVEMKLARERERELQRGLRHRLEARRAYVERLTATANAASRPRPLEEHRSWGVALGGWMPDAAAAVAGAASAVVGAGGSAGRVSLGAAHQPAESDVTDGHATDGPMSERPPVLAEGQPAQLADAPRHAKPLPAPRRLPDGASGSGGGGDGRAGRATRPVVVPRGAIIPLQRGAAKAGLKGISRAGSGSGRGLPVAEELAGRPGAPPPVQPPTQPPPAAPQALVPSSYAGQPPLVPAAYLRAPRMYLAHHHQPPSPHSGGDGTRAMLARMVHDAAHGHHHVHGGAPSSGGAALRHSMAPEAVGASPYPNGGIIPRAPIPAPVAAPTHIRPATTSVTTSLAVPLGAAAPGGPVRSRAHTPVTAAYRLTLNGHRPTFRP